MIQLNTALYVGTPTFSTTYRYITLDSSFLAVYPTKRVALPTFSNIVSAFF